MDNNILKLTLDAQIQDLTVPYLVRWLEYLPDNYRFRNCEDVLRGLFSTGAELEESEMMDSTDYDWILARGVYANDESTLRLELNGDQVVIVDVGQRSKPVVWSAELPPWFVKIQATIELLTEVHERPVSAQQLRDLLMGLFLDGFYGGDND